jgi:hypothetical protein
MEKLSGEVNLAWPRFYSSVKWAEQHLPKNHCADVNDRSPDSMAATGPGTQQVLRKCPQQP